MARVKHRGKRKSGSTPTLPRRLPEFDEVGNLPAGIHACTLKDLEHRTVLSLERARLWGRFMSFLRWVESTGNFKFVYVGGGFVSDKTAPTDLDVILETNASFSREAFSAMEPFFRFGLKKIHAEFSVHLHFWIEGIPEGIDFRSFFQYIRPQDTSHRIPRKKKGIVRLDLNRVTPGRLAILSGQTTPRLLHATQSRLGVE